MDLIRGFKDNCGFGLIANIKNIPTHENVEDAITALERMMHRGAIAADGKSGDGSGLLFSMPNEFMKKEAHRLGVDLPKQFAVAMIFFRLLSSTYPLLFNALDRSKVSGQGVLLAHVFLTSKTLNILEI